MRNTKILALLDLAAQIADVGVLLARRLQLLREARELYDVATGMRQQNCDLLLAVEERTASLSEDSKRRLILAVHAILRDQVAFDEACIDILDGTRN